MEEQSEANHLCFFLSFNAHLSPLVALLDCMCFSAFCYLINPSIIPQQRVADNDTFHQLSLPQAPAITRCPDSQSVRLPLNNDRSQFCTIMYKSVVRSYAASRKTAMAVLFFFLQHLGGRLYHYFSKIPTSMTTRPGVFAAQICQHLFLMDVCTVVAAGQVGWMQRQRTGVYFTQTLRHSDREMETHECNSDFSTDDILDV